MAEWELRGGTMWDLGGPVAFSPDGRTLAADYRRQKRGDWQKLGEKFGGVTLWDVASGKERASFREHAGFVHTLAFSPDGKTLASAGEDRTVRLWDVASGKERASFRVESRIIPSLGAIECVAFSPDGKTLAIGDGGVRLWDVTTGKEKDGLRAYSASEIRFVAFSPDGKMLAATGRASGGIWDVALGKNRAVLRADGPVAFSPDGKVLVTGGSSGVLLWDVPGAPSGQRGQ